MTINSLIGDTHLKVSLATCVFSPCSDPLPLVLESSSSSASQASRIPLAERAIDEIGRPLKFFRRDAIRLGRALEILMSGSSSCSSSFPGLSSSSFPS